MWEEITHPPRTHHFHRGHVERVELGTVNDGFSAHSPDSVQQETTMKSVEIVIAVHEEDDRHHVAGEYPQEQYSGNGQYRNESKV